MADTKVCTRCKRELP